MREIVSWFAQQMENKLAKNDSSKGKEGYLRADYDWLFECLYLEFLELEKELEKDNKENDAIIAEAADVANFALMIAHKAKQNNKKLHKK